MSARALSPGELERYLHEHIPLSRAMGTAVVSANEAEVLLRAPLAPNINHRETVFGGSASALCILAAWSLVHVRLANAGLPSRVVIQRNEMNYARPVEGEFQARASVRDAGGWDAFVKLLRRRGKARIALVATLEGHDGIAGDFAGEFVAVRQP